MLLIFKKKWLKNLANGAWAYIDSEYKKPSKIEYCRTRNFGKDVSSQPVQDKTTTSREQDTALEQNQSGGIRFSLKDNYNANAVDHFMERISTGPVADGTAALDASIDISFVDKMLEHINKKHLRDSTVYKAARVDRRLFSKIVSDRTYKPAKDTCLAFALALQLTLDETNDLLSRAGYTLSHSSKRDVIIEYFIREKVYDLNVINEILYRLHQKIIGR